MIRANIVRPVKVVRAGENGRRPWIIEDACGYAAVTWQHSSHIAYPVRYKTKEAAQRVADSINSGGVK